MMPSIESRPNTSSMGKRRDARPLSAHREFNYMSHSQDADQLRAQAQGLRDTRFGPGFFRKPRDTSIDMIKQAEMEAKMQQGAMRESVRQQFLVHTEKYNGYDIINGAVINEQVGRSTVILLFLPFLLLSQSMTHRP
eukprot:TRINITY_DN533_c0_g2_i2.p1 TRINITY_DN533_c0_g2~~TRINITY_DN533_c0_g2_i2.p1  ORF type:complete len:137 (+),score=18.02 TRINITY_DN533_c0_g2_i2:207-617(+)